MSQEVDFIAVRSFLFNNVENILENLNARKQDKKNDSDDLFGGGGEEAIKEMNWVQTKSLKSKYEILLEEKTSLGLYVSGNPLDDYLPLLEWLRDVSYTDNLHLILVEKIRKIFTKAGGMMLAMQITVGKQPEIEGEQIEGLIFPKNALKFSPVLEEKELFWARGKMSQKKKKEAQEDLGEGEIKEYDELPKLLIDEVVPFLEGVKRVFEKEVSFTTSQLLDKLNWAELKTNPNAFKKILDSKTEKKIHNTHEKALPKIVSPEPIVLKLKKSLGKSVLMAIKKSEFSGGILVSIELETAEGFKKAKGNFWTTREVINLVKNN